MSNSFPHPFKDFKQQWMKLYRDLPKQLSNMAMNEFKENFRRQGFETDSGTVEKWKKRKSEGGRKSKTARPLLVKSGRLRRSFKTRPSFGTARVINDAPYAQAMNEGFKGTEKVKAHKRIKTKRVDVKYTTKTGKERMRAEKRADGFTKVKSFSRKMNIPARPFMVTTKGLLKKFENKIEEQLKKLFGK